jgi:hypothetical protein
VTATKCIATALGSPLRREWLFRRLQQLARDGQNHQLRGQGQPWQLSKHPVARTTLAAFGSGPIRPILLLTVVVVA